MIDTNSTKFREAHEYLRSKLHEELKQQGLPSIECICEMLHKLPEETMLYHDRNIGNVQNHLYLTPTTNNWTFDDLNGWANAMLPETGKEAYWTPCMICASGEAKEYPELELPDDGYMRYAAKSLEMLASNSSYSLSLRFEARLYQHSLGVDEIWEDIDKSDPRLFRILQLSLPLYQRTIPPRYSFEIASMLADLDAWLQNFEESVDGTLYCSTPEGKAIVEVESNARL